MPRWEPVRATEGVIHLWRADLEAVEDGLVEDLLCADELARAAQILRPRERVLWARSRGVLRSLLGRYLDRDPRALDFVLGPHGKLALAPEGPAPATSLRFNLSHSGPLALYAVTAGREIGIDIEHTRARYTAAFLRAWVAREAAVKCRGAGLATPSQDSPAAGLWTAALDLGPRAAAAVAVAGGERCELAFREWV
jgi:4'-phosphopantetheinyl transferase